MSTPTDVRTTDERTPGPWHVEQSDHPAVQTIAIDPDDEYERQLQNGN